VSLLAVEGLVARHGLLQAVSEVSFTLDDGERLALVGANGAGKTTLLRAIAGAHRPAAGRIVFDGRDVTSVPAHRRVRLGIGLVPEGRRLFPDLTVEENLRVAARSGRKGAWTVERVLEAFPILGPLRRRRASSLSGGEQQAAAIGRTLMTNPRLLLLDEVSLGLAPIVIAQLYAALPAIRAQGTSVLLVEQSIDQALAAADRVYCLIEGRVSLSGRPRDITRADVTRAYFGL
jgi:branched-chain amino acid transport system ATP-binding protein